MNRQGDMVLPMHSVSSDLACYDDMVGLAPLPHQHRQRHDKLKEHIRRSVGCFCFLVRAFSNSCADVE